jgi:hypothetical protein
VDYRSTRSSGRHRVLPPQPEAPDEDLVSLIYFYEADHDAVVTPLEPPIGKVSGLEPVSSSAFNRDALTPSPLANGSVASNSSLPGDDATR